MTPAELLKIMPRAAARADVFIDPLNAAMREFGINSPPRQAAFLAQVGHESGQLSSVEESFNYRPQALLDLFNTKSLIRFTYQQAEALGRTPDHPADQEAIANIAYANRGGNGGIESGDGWRYRGAGLIQLTLRDNHKACADHFGIPLERIGVWLRTPEGACRSAARYWGQNGLNQLADAGDFARITLRINGGLNGQPDRMALWGSAREVMGLA